MNAVWYLYPRTSIIILVAILEIALETDLHLRIEPFRHVGHVVAVEWRHLLQITNTVVQM